MAVDRAAVLDRRFLGELGPGVVVLPGLVLAMQRPEQRARVV